MEIRASINNDLSNLTFEMLQLVADYVKSLRLKQAKQKMTVTPLVASMFTGHKGYEINSPFNFRWELLLLWCNNRASFCYNLSAGIFLYCSLQIIYSLPYSREIRKFR